MAKFSSFAALMAGKRAESPVAFPLNVADGTLDAACALAPLTGDEEAQALTYANEYAKKKGGQPTLGDPHYDLALMARRISIGCVDPDSPPKAREPFFDGVELAEGGTVVKRFANAADQVLEILHPETIAYVHERLESWQDQVSPQRKTLDANEILALAIEIAEAESDGPLVKLRPGLRWSFTRTICKLYLGSHEAKSSSGLLAGTSTKSEPKPSESGPEKSNP